jgi:hypothetical protein
MILSVLFCIIGRKIGVVQKFLRARSRIRRRADTDAGRKLLHVAAFRHIIYFTDDFTDENSYIYSKQLISVIKEIEEESGIKYVPKIN